MDRTVTVIRQVHTFIEDNLDKDVSLQAIARHVFLHPSYLSKIYVKETGEGLSAYLLKVRMDRAAYLLKHTFLNVYQVTERVGYINVPHFIKTFKKRYGVTPKKYRLNASE